MSAEFEKQCPPLLLSAQFNTKRESLLAPYSLPSQQQPAFPQASRIPKEVTRKLDELLHEKDRSTEKRLQILSTTHGVIPDFHADIFFILGFSIALFGAKLKRSLYQQ